MLLFEQNVDTTLTLFRAYSLKTKLLHGTRKFTFVYSLVLYLVVFVSGIYVIKA